MISLTQINISEPKVRVARLFFNSTMPLFLQFKAAIKKKKFWFLTFLRRIKDLCLFSIFFILINIWLFSSHSPSSLSLNVGMSYSFSLSLLIWREKVAVFASNVNTTSWSFNCDQFLPGRLNILHTMRRATSVSKNAMGNLWCSKHPVPGLMPQTRLLESWPLSAASSVFLTEV